MSKRFCLRCRKDLTDIMGCYVFVRDGVNFRVVPGLVCVEHGNNGANTMSAEEYARLTGNVDGGR